MPVLQTLKAHAPATLATAAIDAGTAFGLASLWNGASVEPLNALVVTPVVAASNRVTSFVSQGLWNVASPLVTGLSSANLASAHKAVTEGGGGNDAEAISGRKTAHAINRGIVSIVASGAKSPEEKKAAALLSLHYAASLATKTAALKVVTGLVGQPLTWHGAVAYSLATTVTEQLARTLHKTLRPAHPKVG